MTALDELPVHNLFLFLHELRLRRLSMMPADARVVLSGGPSDESYFAWFAERYPGRVERHIGVEYFRPAPDPLPEGVEWLARTLGDLAPVGDGEVDLVFAGQVIEHLWPDDMAGFISEAQRVLRPGGTLVVDSPTRFITAALGWTQPEHTIELEVDEIIELLHLAGFVDVSIKGIWLCYDRDAGRLLPLDPFGGGDDWPWRRRVIEGDDRPGDSFLWWAEARNSDVRGDPAAVRRRVYRLYDQVRPSYFERMRTEIGTPADDSVGRAFRAPRGRRGMLLQGPSIAMPPGQHEAVFRLRADSPESRLPPSRTVAEVEVTRDDGQVVAQWSLTARDLPPGGAEREIVLPFHLRDSAFNTELRVRSLGVVPLIASLPVAVREAAGSGSRLTARRLGEDPARVRAEDALRNLQWVAGWPMRRLLDPRLEGLRMHTEWAAAATTQKIEGRANDLSVRIDRLSEQLHPTPIESTPTERTILLPYVLSALGALPPAAEVVVGDTARGAISVVLASLGYDVRTTPLREPNTLARAVIARAASLDLTTLEQVIGTVHPNGILVMIAEGMDRARITPFLEGWLIEDETVREPPVGGSVTLLRASPPPAVAAVTSDSL